VIVVGNGDTATDCVATALRQGAVSVTQLVRRPRPAETPRVWPYRSQNEKTDYGQEEAAAVLDRFRRGIRPQAPHTGGLYYRKLL